MKITRIDLEKALMRFEWHFFDNTAELCCMLDNIINDYIIKGNNNLYLQQQKNDFDKITAWLRKKHTTAEHIKKKLDNQEMFSLEDLAELRINRFQRKKGRRAPFSIVTV